MVDPATTTELAKKLVDFLNKSNLLPALFKPWQIKRVAKAEAEAQRTKKLIFAKTKKEIESINNGTHTLNKNLELIPVSKDEPNNLDNDCFRELFIKAIGEESIQDKLREITNISIAIDHAEQILQQDSSIPSDDELDMDWFNRWKDMAANFSNEDMQCLWGKILADAIKSPNGASLRVLSFFQNLDHKTAKLVNDLTPFIIDGSTVSSDIVKKHYKLEDLLFFEELGILQAINSPLSYTKDFVQQNDGMYLCLVSFKNVLFIARKDTSKKLSFQAYHLTSLGRDIMRFATVDTCIDLSNDVLEFIYKDEDSVSYIETFDINPQGLFGWNTNNEIRIK